VGESYYNEYIAPVVQHLDQIGLVSDSDGAKVVFPPGSKHEQPLMVVKSDGGYGYDSTDMAAIWYRRFELEADWIIYVTDAGQGPHFELVFEAATAAGWVDSSVRLDHVPFGLVVNPDDGKKYKTRSGKTERLVDLLDGAITEMLKGMDERDAKAKEEGKAVVVNLSPEQRQETAKILGYGAVKYADLKSNRISNYAFSYERMLDPNGNTAVYLLYAGARMSKILRDSGLSLEALLASGARVELKPETERALGFELLRFQEVVELALAKLQPNFMCEYLYNLCSVYTKFYVACKVLGSPEQSARLLLLYSVETVMRKGFSLIGLGYLERI